MHKPFLDYYIQNNISPVAKKIQNKEKFFLQREYLYRSLGIFTHFNAMKIIEFGPGNGINAIFNNSLSPLKYVLVDGNHLAIKNIQHNLQSYFSNLDNIEIHHTLIEKFSHEPNYNLVIAENMLTNQNNPIEFSRMISQNVKPGGILMMTTNDEASVLSENLRVFVGLLASSKINSFEEKVDYLTQYFTLHLNALNVVSRDFRDWVLDNIVHTDYSLGERFFSFENAIDGLSAEFIFHHSSPRIYNDLRWYKAVCNKDEFRATNAIAKECYYKNILNLLDYRLNVSPHSIELGHKIIELAKSIRTSCISYLNDNQSVIGVVKEQLNALADEIRELAPETFASLKAYVNLLESGQFDLMQTEPSLINWWGRGTQYITLIKGSGHNLKIN